MLRSQTSICLLRNSVCRLENSGHESSELCYIPRSSTFSRNACWPHSSCSVKVELQILSASPQLQPPSFPNMESREASYLVRSCLRYMLKYLQANHTSSEKRSSLYRAHGRLKIWANDFGTDSAELDNVLDHSKYLKEPTFLLLADIAECLLTGFNQGLPNPMVIANASH